MFSRRKSEPAAEETAPPTAPAGGWTEHPEFELTKDTLAAILRTLGEFALPTSKLPAEAFARQVEELARQILVPDSAGDGLEGACRRARVVVRDQRQHESKEYKAHRESAQVIVSDLLSTLRETLAKNEADDREIETMLHQIEEAAESGDLSTIRSVASQAAGRIRNVISRQRDRERTQIDKRAAELTAMLEEMAEAQAEELKDDLTGLHGRDWFDQSYAKKVLACRTARLDVAMFVFSIDNLEALVEQHGSGAEQQIVAQVARTLTKAFPRKGDMLARFDPRSFVAVCPNVSANYIRVLADRARRAIEDLDAKVDGVLAMPTLSVGYALLRPGDEPAELLARAVDAVEYAIGLGGNRVQSGER